MHPQIVLSNNLFIGYFPPRIEAPRVQILLIFWPLHLQSLIFSKCLLSKWVNEWMTSPLISLFNFEDNNWLHSRWTSYSHKDCTICPLSTENRVITGLLSMGSSLHTYIPYHTIYHMPYIIPYSIYHIISCHTTYISSCTHAQCLFLCLCCAHAFLSQPALLLNSPDSLGLEPWRGASWITADQLMGPCPGKRFSQFGNPADISGRGQGIGEEGG